MAKTPKKDKNIGETTEETTSTKPIDYTELILNDVAKRFKMDDLIIKGSDLLNKHKKIISVTPSIDSITGGGFAEGSWVSVSTPPKAGKTTLGLTFAAQCQKPENGDRTVYYANIEHRLKEKDLNGIEGLNPGRNFYVIESTENKILVAQDYLSIIKDILYTHKNAVVIIDSVSKLCDARTMEGGIGTETRGSTQRLIGQFIDLVTSAVPVNNAIVYGILHQYADTGGGKGKIDKQASSWAYQADYQLRGYKKQLWLEAEKPIGQVVEWECKHSATSIPYGKCESRLRYGIGFDRTFELIEIAASLGVIEPSGSWFGLSFLTNHGLEEVKVQGKEKIWNLLRENPLWVTWLYEELKSLKVL